MTASEHVAAPRRASRLGSLALTLAAAAVFCLQGCERSRTAPTAAPEAEGSTTAPGGVPGGAAPEIDAERLHGVLAQLASDGLGGRYTLSSQDIGRAADFLAQQFEQAGIAAVGETYRVDFPVVTGVRVGDEQHMVVGGKRPKEIARDKYTPLPLGSSAEVEAEVVFVGYASRAEDPAAYDDLAGIDVRDKIALVLLDAPGRPDQRALYLRVRYEVQDFERLATSLREQKDEAALAKLHVRTRKKVAQLVEPFLRRPLPKSYVEPPADPMAELTFDALMTPIREASEAAKGPSFGYGEGRLRTKVERLVEAGAAGVVAVRGPRSFFDRDHRAVDALPSPDEVRTRSEPHSIPVVQIRWKEAERRFRIGGRKLSAIQAAIDEDLEPQSKATGVRLRLVTNIETTTAGVPNVLATIPGSDLAEEIVVLGAHYDHIGTDAEGRGHCRATENGDEPPDAICNGADDNASGTATVVEVARALAEAGVRPRRTLVFALFAGEEIGLLGSKALADHPPKTPPFDRGKVVAMINLDMIGRLSDEGLAIGGISSSSAWMPLLDEVGPHGMPILYERSITTRSDHASFYRHDIPVLFFFTHLHPDYHAPGDETDHINRQGLAKIATLVTDLMITVSDGPPIPFTPPSTPDEGLVRSLPGDNPETVERAVSR